MLLTIQYTTVQSDTTASCKQLLGLQDPSCCSFFILAKAFVQLLDYVKLKLEKGCSIGLRYDIRP